MLAPTSLLYFFCSLLSSSTSIEDRIIDTLLRRDRKLDFGIREPGLIFVEWRKRRGRWRRKRIRRNSLLENLMGHSSVKRPLLILTVILCSKLLLLLLCLRILEIWILKNNRLQKLTWRKCSNLTKRVRKDINRGQNYEVECRSKRVSWRHRLRRLNSHLRMHHQH